ncbi:pectate lyase [Phytophthora sojae]|uniref:Probable pectate lyase F n=1 Tax=Phytophthora sojae (strain P6497) TaxID=1094619 RepID=G4ZA82_PHYSP|nr:pectate lyase [Phytophthora sojae]EGZ21967.1 pectate lyase [Phytophthora sojae]|eukprot:XP_009524684.1 pectate lyase [Phytophthora sojae]
MVKSFATSAALLVAAATAASVPDGTWPTSTGSVHFSEAHIVKAGEVFDGKMQTYERSDVSCEGQTESGADTAVFKMEPGATLKNVIIGKNQMEGVHCDKHDCTIENVWWDDVCEDALSVKGGTASSVTTVTGGGARSADDKVIQHNGYGTVKIDGFYGEDISKLYRSCGTCGDKQRKVDVSNVYVVNPGNAVVTVNKNWNDEATLSNVWVKSSGDKVKICQWSQGNADGEPSMLGDGPSPPLCQYSESDIHLNGDVSQATGTSNSSSSAPNNTTQSSSTGSSSTAAQTASTTSSQESASSQAATNSTTGASEASGPGTVAPANSGSAEQTQGSSESSQTEQQQSNEESTEDPTQQTQQTQQSSASASSKKSDNDSDDAKNEEQTITAGGSSTTSGASTTSSGRSTSTDSPTQSSSTGSATDDSSNDSTTQSSTAGSTTTTGSATQSSSAGSTAQTGTNSSTSTSTGSIPDGTWPTSTGSVKLTAPQVIKAGEVFDGKMQTFDRSDITCSDGEGQKDTAVFLVEAGGTLKNAIIGKNQKEGVHCDDHDCTIENVWWDDVCEDALSIKGGSASSVTTVTNCGAKSASDKVVQHNGQGTVNIDGFYAENFGKLYRSCGTCGDIPRTVTLKNVYAVDPLVSVVTVNKNYGDKATLSNIRVKTSDGNNDVKVCQWSQGGSTPSNLGDGPSGTLCQYSESDVQINQ